MRDIRAVFREHRDEAVWRLRKGVATWLIRHWAGILWIALFLTFTLLVANIVVFVTQWKTLDKVQYVGFLLSVVFGFFSVLSVLISVAVLQSLRDLIPDYTHAGSFFERVIRGARRRVYVLTENPAFLQVLDPEGLRRWLATVQERIRTRKIKVVFAYVNRGDLIGYKFPRWAEAVRREVDSLKDEFLNRDTFHVAKNPDYRDWISLVPLRTASLPFYMAIADGDLMGMFCHSVIYPLPGDDGRNDVRESVIRGFLSYDQNIVTALKAVFLKFLQLNAAVYEYQCSKCAGRSYKFDHDLLRSPDQVFGIENLAGAPEIGCDVTPGCSGRMRGELRELISLPDTSRRDKLFEELTGERWQD